MHRRRFNRTFIHGVAAIAFAPVARALDLSSITNSEATRGLRAALERGARIAVGKLGVADGFLGNPKVKIPLPDGLKQVERAMRALGRQDQFDDLVTGMNRAAEAAVPQAKPLLIDAVKRISVADAKAIVGGGDDSVTRFFRDKTGQPLAQRFLPIVKQTTDRIGLARRYNALAQQAGALGLAGTQDRSIEHYVTLKALDGLFLMIGEEERAIRRDPLGTGSDLLRRVFGG